MLWFTADTHFGHSKILEHGRAMFDTIEQHDEALIAKWNAVVGEKDDVYHLGDFAYRNKRPVTEYVGALKGHIHIIRGNHDDVLWKKYRNLFKSSEEGRYVRWENEMIWMCHYSCRVWRNWLRGAWHLFGHSHGGLKGLPGRTLDVGVDCHDFTPWSFEELRVVLNAIPKPIPKGSDADAIYQEREEA